MQITNSLDESKLFKALPPRYKNPWSIIDFVENTYESLNL